MSHGHSHGPGAPGHGHAHPVARDAGSRSREHDLAHRQAAHATGASLRRLSVSLALTVAVMLAEAIGGWLSGSLALLSDAAHMLTDAGALGLALFAAYLATRPADDKRTFGYRRVEVLAAQVNVGALVVLALWIGWEALERLRTPHPAIDLRLMAVIALVGLSANLGILWALHKEHTLNARSASRLHTPAARP